MSITQGSTSTAISYDLVHLYAHCLDVLGFELVALLQQMRLWRAEPQIFPKCYRFGAGQQITGSDMLSLIKGWNEGRMEQQPDVLRGGASKCVPRLASNQKQKLRRYQSTETEEIVLAVLIFMTPRATSW